MPLALSPGAAFADGGGEQSDPDPVEAPSVEERQPASRIPLPPLEDLSEAERAVLDGATAYYGKPTGSRVIFLETPELGLAWRGLLSALETSELPGNLWQLTILTASRHWSAQFLWYSHEDLALEAGLSREVVEALKHGEQPPFESEAEAAVYAYLTELYEAHSASEETYERVRNVIGTRQMIELTALFGHYNNIAITLVAHEVHLPDGVSPPLPGLTE